MGLPAGHGVDAGAPAPCRSRILVPLVQQGLAEREPRRAAGTGRGRVEEEVHAEGGEHQDDVAGGLDQAG